jgi:hypothetical protein
LDDIDPEPAKVVDTARCRAPKRRIADKQTAGECAGSGLKQRVEGNSIARERMRRCCQIDPLASQDVKLGDGSDRGFFSS